MAVKLNLGCGQKYLEGYLNCDCVESVRADRHFDLNTFPYPFEAGTVDEIFMDNVLEHLDDVVKVMEELNRLLKPGGLLKIIVPYGRSDWALQDPTHKHFFTERSMDYFSEGHPYNFYSKATFEVLEARLHGDANNGRQKMRNMIPFKSILRWFIQNLYDNIHFTLRKPVRSAAP